MLLALLLTMIAGDAPSAWTATKAGHATFVHDTKRDRMVRFAGRGSSLVSDVWTFSLTDSSAKWERLVTSGPVPAARMRHAAIYDALDDRMLIFGGLSQEGPLDDLWSLSFADSNRWKKLEPQGEGPGAAESPSLLVDSGRRRCLLLGVRGAAWWLWLDGAMAWMRLESSGRGPVDLFGMGAVLDSVGKCAYTYGGDRVPRSSFVRGRRRDADHDDLRGLQADAAQLELAEHPHWTRGTAPRPYAPPASCDVSLTFDEKRARVLLYVGSQGNSTLGELWGRSIGPRSEWHRLQTPFGREAGMKILVDPERDEMFVFRGVNELSPPQRVPLMEVAAAPPPAP